MRTFDYIRADSAQAAVAAAGAGGRFIAGGTNLVDLMKAGVETPETLVDISRLDLARVEETGEGGLRIGALVPNSDLAAHPLRVGMSMTAKIDISAAGDRNAPAA